MAKTSLKTFTETFMGKLIPCFRPPTDDAGNAKALVMAYFSQLSEFDAETLGQAASQILRTRKDPFFPTLAECLDVCRAIAHRKSNQAMAESYMRDADARMAADGWEFKPGEP